MVGFFQCREPLSGFLQAVDLAAGDGEHPPLRAGSGKLAAVLACLLPGDHQGIAGHVFGFLRGKVIERAEQIAAQAGVHEGVEGGEGFLVALCHLLQQGVKVFRMPL